MSRGDPLRVRDYLEQIAEAIASMSGTLRRADKLNYPVLAYAAPSVFRQRGCCSGRSASEGPR